MAAADKQPTPPAGAPQNEMLIKRRQILFCQRHCDAQHAKQQLEHALALLNSVDGIEDVSIKSSDRIQLSYDIQIISLQIIERALIELGFHLDNSLLTKLKRALIYYCEDVQRDNLGIDQQQAQTVQSVFINRYEQLRHGCRDGKPKHWRQYL